MKKFNTIKEAKKYASQFKERQFETVWVGDKEKIICGADKVYEEELWCGAYNLVKDFCEKFGRTDNECDKTEMATEIRDLVIAWFEGTYGVEFIDICNEY